MKNSIVLRIRQQWRQPGGTVDLIFYAKIAILVAAYYVLSHFIFDSIVIDESSYRQPVIALEALRYPSVLVVFVPYVVLLLLNYVKFDQNTFYGKWSWDQFKAEEKINVKYLIVVIVFVLTWAFSANELNFYYNNPYYLDRLLLIILACLTLVSPLFVPIFFLFAFIFVSQFNYPEFLNYSWFDKKLLFNILLLFSIFVLAGIFTRFRPSIFIFLALCIVGSDYFYAGSSKLLAGNRVIDWVLKNRLHNLFVSSYVNGWVRFVDQPTILQIAGIIKFFDIPLQIFTLIIELGGILLVAGRKVSTTVLVGSILLHVGIFLSSGIFFWKWIVLDVGLIILLWKYRGEVDRLLFTRRNALFSLGLIFFGYIYFSQMSMGLYDTRVNNFYEFELVDRNGDIYRIDRGFMAPYDISFSQNRFFYLSDDNLIVGTYGSTGSLELYEMIESATTSEEILQLKAALGRNPYDELMARAFDDFIGTYFANMNQGLDRFGGVNNILTEYAPSPPHHINSFGFGESYPGLTRIATVRVRFIETYYNGTDIIVLEDKIIREIDISPDT